MDTRITLNFDEAVIAKAKKFAQKNNISLSMLTEYLFRKVTSTNINSTKDLPVSEWANKIAHGEVESLIRQKKIREMKAEYFESRR